MKNLFFLALLALIFIQKINAQNTFQGTYTNTDSAQISYIFRKDGTFITSSKPKYEYAGSSVYCSGGQYQIVGNNLVLNINDTK